MRTESMVTVDIQTFSNTQVDIMKLLTYNYVYNIDKVDIIQHAICILDTISTNAHHSSFIWRRQLFQHFVVFFRNVGMCNVHKLTSF